MADSNDNSTTSQWRVIAITNLLPYVFYDRLNIVCAEAGHKVVGLLTTAGPKSRRSTDYQKLVAAASPAVDVLVSNHPDYWAEMLAPLKPDLIVSCGFPWRIPKNVIDLPTYGAINLHPALLPKGRGPGSIAWCLRNGDAEMGMTIHYLADGFDTGNILVQGTVPVTDDDDFDSATDKLDNRLMELLKEALPMVARREPGTVQNEDDATFCSLFEPEWRHIDWLRPAREIHFQIRSWTGERNYPLGALGLIDGAQMQIIRSQLLPPSPTCDATEPGTILERTDDRLIVQCGDGPLTILKWNPA